MYVCVYARTHTHCTDGVLGCDPRGREETPGLKARNSSTRKLSFSGIEGMSGLQARAFSGIEGMSRRTVSGGEVETCIIHDVITDFWGHGHSRD